MVGWLGSTCWPNFPNWPFVPTDRPAKSVISKLSNSKRITVLPRISPSLYRCDNSSGIHSMSVPQTSAGWPTLSCTADPLYVLYITQSRSNFTLRSQPLLSTADSIYCILHSWPNLFYRTELSSAPPLIVIFQCHKALGKRNCYLRLTYLNFIFSCSILF